MEGKDKFEKYDNQYYYKKTLKLTLELYKNKHLNRDGVDEVLKTFNEYITEVVLKNIEYRREKAHKKKKDPIQSMDIILYESRNPFKNFLTEKQRFAIYRHECSFLDPIKFTVAISQSQKPITAVHLPLINQLKIFFEIPGLLQEILNYEEKTYKLFNVKGVYSNVLHGQLWQKLYKPLFQDKTVFPLFLFFDDFETGNALGSHSGKQKFGGVYVSLPTLPPHLRAKLKNIFLTTIFHSKHREESNNKVFLKVIMELNHLSQTGMTVTINGKSRQIFFQCITLLGDNLGLNQICGFEGSFSAEYYCRRCRLNSSVCKHLHYECPEAFRTIDNYETDLKQSNYGIKNKCIFNEINNFHIIQNPSVDLMHDVFEGLARYTIEGVLTHLIFTFNK